MKKTHKRTSGQIFLRLFFLLYGAAMIWLLFGQRIENSIFAIDLNTLSQEAYLARLKQCINLAPLDTLERFWANLHGSNPEHRQHALINLVGNVVMFIPLGVFLPGIFMKKPNFFKFFLLITVMIVLVEVVQLFTLLGVLDIDDLILNLAGATVGYVMWKLYALRRKK